MINEKEVNAGAYHPLVLAYMGDAIYEVYIRSMLIRKKNVSVHRLHICSILYVKASAQAYVLKNILEELTQDELYIVKRGRNAKSGTIPKNAKVLDYRHATAFEALIGYLYLNRDSDRLDYIIERAIDVIDKKEAEGVNLQ